MDKKGSRPSRPTPLEVCIIMKWIAVGITLQGSSM